MNDIIFNWLKGYPGLELLQRQQVDAVPGGCGLYFRGVTVEDSRCNLLGATQKRKTLHFRLNRYGDRVESPIFFLMLEQWVQTNAQQLGSDHTAASNTQYQGTDHTAALKNSRCVRDTDSGLTLWEADLEVSHWEEL